MVLKKSKGSFAGTGNTVRKGGKQSMQRALKAASITKKVGNRGALALEQRDGEEDIVIIIYYHICSINWLICLR